MSVIDTTISKTLMLRLSLYVTFFYPIMTVAQLPQAIAQRLPEAQLTSQHISLIIQPIGSAETSHLAPLLTPLTLTEPPSTNTLQPINTALPLVFTVQHLTETPRTPASIMKLIPTFIALDTLGSDFVWLNAVRYEGWRLGDTLHGDLIIKGSGDPKLTYQRLMALLAQVQDAGIRHIKGNIILDSSIFQNVTKDPAKFDGQALRPYNASPDGFLVNFNSIELVTLPTKDNQATVTMTPVLADITFPKIIRMRQGHCGTAKQSLDPMWHTETLSLRKSLPSSCGRHVFYIAHPNPKVFAQHVVKGIWEDLGNSITGKVISTEATITNNIHPQPLLNTSWNFPIAVYPSLPLKQQIHDINHYSNNVMTEQILLSTPVYADKQSDHHNQPSQSLPSPVFSIFQPTNSDYSLALSFVDKWWQARISSSPPKLSNGSGLCRDCSVTAQSMADLLSVAYEHPEFESFANSLGVAGVSGTIISHTKRLPNSQAAGRAWIKTGTLDNVTSMAGYVHGVSGQDYVVVGILNSDTELDTHHARLVLDTMLDWTAKH